MKTVLLVLAVMGLAVQAQASKARVKALQGASFLVDTQTIFTNPAHIHANGQLMTLEMGNQATSGTKSEGGLFRKETDATYGVYLGHANDKDIFYRSSLGGTFIPQDNPVEVFYGKENWAFSIGASRADKKTTDANETSVFGRFGKVDGDLQYFGALQLISQAKAGSDKFNGSPYLTGGILKDAGRYHYGAQLTYDMGNLEVTGNKSNFKTIALELSALDRSLKTSTRELYYGFMFNYLDTSVESNHLTSLSLPFVIGLETNVASWLTFRGSVQQNILLGSTKNDSATPPGNKEDTIGNDTTVALGVGLKWNEFTLDGTLSGSSTGQLNGNAVLADAAVTYRF